ncbi:MAG: flavodoxin, partial [Anaerolineae bacterium]
LTTAGIEGLWTPVLAPRQGYCNYGCNSCGQICPTGAIPRLDMDVKREMVLGLAVVERDRCLAWHDNQQCIVCEEMCPVPEKAITLDDITVTDADGYEVLIRRPVVIEGLCIGCGSCEWHCPVVGDSAIRVQHSPLAGQPRSSASAAGQAALISVVPTAMPSPTKEIVAATVTAATPSAGGQATATPSATAAPTRTPAAEQATPEPQDGPGPLVVYFSRTGNTREIARQIQALVGGELLEIEPVVPYPADYNECTQVAARELREDARPPIQPLPADLGRFDTVFLGYPNWWGTIPMAVATFLESQTFAGRTVIPFCTHLGSRLGRSVEDLQVLCAGATILGGLDVRGSLVYEAQETVAAWVAELGALD